MTERVLMTGNEALAEGAIRAGCDAYYGYPITPQNEITAYMASHMPARGRIFLQAESEIAAINMVFGSAAAGRRAMTSSSGPGISLKQEGISFLAGAELPAVLANIQRGGPGLGNIAPSQSDYFQATKGGGHGDYRQIVLAPWSVQEMHDLTIFAFELADRYRMPVMVLADGRLGQMMEPLRLFDGPAPVPPAKPWALSGARGRRGQFIRSLYLVESELEAVNARLQAKYRRIEADEPRWEETATEDAEWLLAAYGTSARIAKGVLRRTREEGHPVGLFRPVTLWPFPSRRLQTLAQQVRGILTVEMSSGQMLEDVQLATRGRVPTAFVGRMGGLVPTEAMVREALDRLMRSPLGVSS